MNALDQKISLLLRTGKMLMENGANSNRIKRNLLRAGRVFSMDGNDLNYHLSLQTIIVTYKSGEGYVSRLENVRSVGVNMQILSGISRMLSRAVDEKFTIEQYRDELDRLSSLPPQYNRYWVIFWVGVACAAFSALMGADLAAFVVTLIASSVALFFRQEMHRRRFNGYLVVGISSAIASAIASLNAVIPLSETPHVSVIASVLFLIPGVPLINSIDDLLDGFTLLGVSRLVVATLIVLAISLGMILVVTSAFGIYTHEF